MNPKVIGVIAGVALALVLFRSDLMFWRHGGVEELYNEAEALYEYAGKSEDYKKYEDAIQKYNAALEAANKEHELYGEFYVLVNYKIALCYSDMAEREGQDGVADYDKALDIIEMISPRATVPMHQEGITYLWGHILYKQGNYTEAETKLREFIEQFPNSKFVEDALYALGNINYNLKDYPKARQDFKSLLDKFPDSSYAADAGFLIAQSYLEENNFPEANEWFEKLNAEESKNKAADEAKYRYAHNLLRLGNNYQSLRDYEDFVANYPQSKFLAAAYFDMGNIYLKDKEYEKARQHFELALRALQNTAENDEIYRGMALRARLGIAASSFELGDWQKVVDSKDIMGQIQTEAPEFIGYYNNLLNEAYYQKGDYEKVESYNTSDALEAEVWSLSQEADNHFKKEEYAQAAAKYSEVWAKAPTRPDLFKLKFRAKYREGLCYFKTGKFNEAAAAYHLALYLAEGVAQDFIEQKDIDSCRLNLALTYEKLNNWTDARSNYNEILKDSDSKYYKDAQLLLAQSYTQENRLKEAIDEYEKLSDDTARINRAKLLHKVENYTEAAALYEAIANEIPPSEHANEAQYMAGLCYYKIEDKNPNDLSKAIGIFDKVIENPDSPYVLDAYYGKVLANKDLAEKYLSLWAQADDAAKREFAEKSLSQWLNTEQVALAVLARFKDEADTRKTSIDTIRKYATGMRYKMEGIPKLDKDQQDIINENPDPTAKAKAQLKRAQFYFKDQQFGDPLKAYQDLINMNPGDADVRIAKYQIVAYHYQLDNYTECIGAADDAIRYNPDENMLVRIYYMRGKSKLNLGDEEGGVADFMIVAQMDSDTDPSRKPLIIDANQLLSDLSPGMGDISAAIEAYEVIIKEADDITSQGILTKINAYYQKGLLYEKQGDIDNAIQALDDLRNYYDNREERIGGMDRPEMQNIIDKIIDAGLRRASLKFARGELDTAITDAANIRNEVISSEYTTPLRKIHAHYQVGYLYYQRMVKAIEDGASQDDVNLYGRTAIPAFQEALRIQNAPPEATSYVRDSAFLMGEIAAAIPGQVTNAKNFLNAFITRARNGEFGPVDTDEKVRELLPKALFSLAKVEHRLGNYDEAISRLNDLMSQFPDGQDKPLWQLQLGDAYFAKTDLPRAKSEYEKVLSLVPQPNPADEASYGIGDEALYGMIVSVDQMRRQTADENQQRAFDEEKKRLNERMVTDYQESDYAPVAYINLGVLAFNNGADSSDVNIQIGYFKEALNNYQIAYNHPKIDNDKIGENKPDAKAKMQRVLRYLIKRALEASSLRRNAADESGALTYNAEAIFFCDQLIDVSPDDTAIANEVGGEGGYIQQIEAEMTEIEPFLPNNPEVLEVRNQIDEVRRRINP